MCARAAGWINPSLNALTAYVLHERRNAWLGILVLWGVVPFIVANLCYYRREESGRGPLTVVPSACANEERLDKQKLIHA